MAPPVVVMVDRVLPGPAAIVWELITDWEHQDDWMLEARDFVVLTDQREGIGVEAAATVSIGGITTRDKVRVVGWEQGRRLAIAHEGWVSGTGELTLWPASGGAETYLAWREELHPPRALGVLGTIGLSLFKPLMARVFARDLRVLAGLVRARAAG